MDYRKALRRLADRGETFALAFLDPPYGRGLIDEAADALDRSGVLSAGAVVVAEAAARDPKEKVPPAWVLESERRYGDTRVAFYEVTPRPEKPKGSDTVKEDR